MVPSHAGEEPNTKSGDGFVFIRRTCRLNNEARLMLRPELRGHFDFSVFVRADFSVTTARAEQRDPTLVACRIGSRKWRSQS